MGNIDDLPLCLAPFYGISIKADESHGFRMKQCCESSLDYSRSNILHKPLDPNAFFNSDIMNDIRDTLKSGRFHDSCISCKYMDKLGINTTQEKYKRTFKQIAQLKGDLSQNELSFLDVRLSNKCNLKCRMCSPNNSSAIAAEMYPGQKSLIEVPDYNSLLAWIDFEKLLFLKISGGEPFVMDETVELLSRKLNKDLTLVILTNGAFLKETILEKLSSLKIKRIHFQVSMDGTKDYLEYIRVGAKWSSIIENLNRLININEHSEVTIGVTYVPQLWNAFDIPNFINWAMSCRELNLNNHIYYPKIFYSNVIQDYLSIENLFDEDKQSISEQIHLIGKEMDKKDFNIFIEPIQKILNGSRKGNLKQFKKETNGHDERYSTSLKKLDERYEKYLC